MSLGKAFRAFALSLVFLALLLAQQPPPVKQVSFAPTPPMGWNSWDSFGLTINQHDFLDQLHWMHEHLQSFGWKYAIVDEGWFLKNPASHGKPAWEYTLDQNGLNTPAPNRFPMGFKALSDQVHALGLKFGIHIVRGIPKEAVSKNLPIAGTHFHAADAADQSDLCEWNPDNFGVKANAAGQAYYDSMARLYANWGVDYLKVDCIARPFKDDEIRMVRQSLLKTNRPIVLSLSPGPTPLEKGSAARENAEIWRVSNDIWDHWGVWPEVKYSPGLVDQFATLAQWARFAGQGHWPDADMLPLGYLGPHPGEGNARPTRLTHDEQRTLLTLWSIARSPLMMGGNLLKMDDWTTSLLTNPEVTAVDQRSSGNRKLADIGKLTIWGAALHKPGDYFVAIFNTTDQPRESVFDWRQLGFAPGEYYVRDLWERRNTGKRRMMTATLAPHASILLRVSTGPVDVR